MSHRMNRSALLASTMLIGVAVPGLAAAQDDDVIIVTGSRLPQANAISASPVTTIGNVEFDIRGTTRVEDMVNTLPQAFAAQGANTSNGATGTAQVSLRGLGATRTLVLVNGHRLQYGSGISSAPDLNQIPAALVDRVEVLTGGASAAYGSDAISGVVNFLMIKDFEGVRIDGQLSGYQHSNNNSAAQDVLLNATPAPGSDVSIPESGVFDGKGQDITLILGANSEDGRGNVTMYAGYRNNDAILEADRDFSKCAYRGGDPVFQCTGSSTTPNGFFTDFQSFAFTLDETTPNTFRPRTGKDVFNFAPTNFFQRPDERFTLGAFAHYEVNDNLEFYSETMFYDYRSDAQIAFTGTFFTTTQLNCDNPLMSDQQAGLLGCTAGQRAGTDPVSNDISSIYIGKRFVEGNPRVDSIRLTSYRMLGGFRGEVPGMEGWNYDTYFQYANTHNSQTYNNDASIPNMQQALFAVDDGAGGVQCRDALARAQGCVPLDLFTVGAVDQSQLDFIMQRSFQDGNTKQYLGEATLTGDLGAYGMKSPWAEDGIGLALGVQWRKDKLSYRPDALFEFGLLSGQGGPTPPVNGEIEATDLYVEAQIPLVTGMAFAEALTFHGGYRHSDVSTSGSNDTWKLAGDWQIVPEIRVRGGWQRAVRAANVIESFTPQSQGLTVLNEQGANQFGDPCAGNGGATTPDASKEACLRTGVTSAQYDGGLIFDNPALQYNAVFGGNPDLKPESSDTYTVGVVLTPNDYVPGNFLLSVDYFDITVDDFVGVISAQDSLDNCMATGDPTFCDLIVRNPNNGSLWTGSATVGFIETNTNTGSLSTSGLDLNMNWSVDFSELGLGEAGGLSVDLVGTYLIDLETESLPGSVPFDCAGFYAGRCGSPSPEWRHKLRTTWQTPMGVDATVSWRYFSSVEQGDSVNGNTSSGPTDQDFELESRNYIDLQGSYNVTENWNVRVGVNNLLDKDPPLTSQTSGFTNGNTHAQTYDAQGRFLFVGTTIDF